VLFSITPNITSWIGVDNSLKLYLDSLDKVSKLKVSLVLPGHRDFEGDYLKRIAEIKAHHTKRLQEAYNIVCEQPELSAYEIAAKMHWRIRAANWEAFPIAQKWFAAGEADAHLDYLKADNAIHSSLKDGKIVFYP
jgi:glyoxylase-like metal-dependent hydrolase (beta-lactamase superfamily II)